MPDVPDTGPVHEVALVELKVSVEAPPDATVVGLAVSVAVGGGGAEPVAAQQCLSKPGAGSELNPAIPPTKQPPPEATAAEDKINCCDGSSGGTSPNTTNLLPPPVHVQLAFSSAQNV